MAQANQLSNQILSNPISAALVDPTELKRLKAQSAGSGGGRLDSLPQLHQLQQVYTDFVQPQLHGSKVVPVILSVGHQVPFIGKVPPPTIICHPSRTHPSPSAPSTPNKTKLVGTSGAV